MNQKGFPLKTTTSIKSKFTTRFLQSLLRLKEQETSTSPNNIRRRTRRIKTAAFSSMALAVGQRRAWSRALIFKLRSRSRRVKHLGLIRRRKFCGLKKKRVIGIKKASRDPSQAEKLRQIVPGGEAMDFCNLLEETAHYIKCLTTQVQVMQKVAHAFSTA